LLQWEETFPDGSFAPAKKGAPQSVKPSGARNEVDGTGRRPRSSTGSSAGKCLSGRSYACGGHARRSQSPPVERRPRQKQKRVIADRASDPDPLRERLRFAALITVGVVSTLAMADFLTFVLAVAE
jgi:hypothetical protein